MSFTDGINIGLDEGTKRRKRSAIPSFSGDLDLDRLSRGIPFGTSQDVNRQTQRNLLGQRGRVEQTPLRIKSEGNIEDAFLTDPLASPTIDSSRKSNGKRKKGKKINKRDKSRRSLVKESARLKGGGTPRSSRQEDIFSPNDNSFSGLGI